MTILWDNNFGIIPTTRNKDTYISILLFRQTPFEDVDVNNFYVYNDTMYLYCQWMYKSKLIDVITYLFLKLLFYPYPCWFQ